MSSVVIVFYSVIGSYGKLVVVSVCVVCSMNVCGCMGRCLLRCIVYNGVVLFFMCCSNLMWWLCNLSVVDEIVVD